MGVVCKACTEHTTPKKMPAHGGHLITPAFKNARRAVVSVGLDISRLDHLLPFVLLALLEVA